MKPFLPKNARRHIMHLLTEDSYSDYNDIEYNRLLDKVSKTIDVKGEFSDLAAVDMDSSYFRQSDLLPLLLLGDVRYKS